MKRDAGCPASRVYRKIPSTNHLCSDTPWATKQSNGSAIVKSYRLIHVIEYSILNAQQSILFQCETFVLKNDSVHIGICADFDDVRVSILSTLEFTTAAENAFTDLHKRVTAFAQPAGQI